MGMHRQKADEAFLIGKPGQYKPIEAYLAGDEIIKIALEHGVDMIHPGYGFLSENSEFAKNVEKAGLIVSPCAPLLPPTPPPRPLRADARRRVGGAGFSLQPFRFDRPPPDPHYFLPLRSVTTRGQFMLTVGL